MRKKFLLHSESPDLDPWTGRPKKSLNTFSVEKFLASLKTLFKKRAGALPPKLPDFLDVKLILIALLALLSLWVISGVFVVGKNERALLLSFAEHEKILQPGWHWMPRFFAKVYITPQSALLEKSVPVTVFTADQSMATFNWQVRYRIDNLREYCLQNNMPEGSLENLIVSVTQQMTMTKSLSDWQGEGRAPLIKDMMKALNNRLPQHHTGLVVSDILLEGIFVPDAIKESMANLNETEKLGSDLLKKAQADANQIQQDVEAKINVIKQKATLEYDSVTQKFNLEMSDYLHALSQYEKAPEITREKIYMQSVHAVLEKTHKVILSENNAKNVLQFNFPVKDSLEVRSKVAANTTSRAPDKSMSDNVVMNKLNFDEPTSRKKSLASIYNEDPDEEDNAP